jgi:hypothetical protein
MRGMPERGGDIHAPIQSPKRRIEVDLGRISAAGVVPSARKEFSGRGSDGTAAGRCDDQPALSAGMAAGSEAGRGSAAHHTASEGRVPIQHDATGWIGCWFFGAKYAVSRL